MNQAAIGSYIARKRKKKNLTQEQLAEHIGVSNKTISKWENGKCMPDYSILQKLCNALHVTLPERMDGEDATEGGVRFYNDEQILDLLRRTRSWSIRKGFSAACFWLFSALPATHVRYDQRVRSTEAYIRSSGGTVYCRNFSGDL